MPPVWRQLSYFSAAHDILTHFLMSSFLYCFLPYFLPSYLSSFLYCIGASGCASHRWGSCLLSFGSSQAKGARSIYSWCGVHRRKSWRKGGERALYIVFVFILYLTKANLFYNFFCSGVACRYFAVAPGKRGGGFCHFCEHHWKKTVGDKGDIELSEKNTAHTIEWLQRNDTTPFCGSC